SLKLSLSRTSLKAEAGVATGLTSLSETPPPVDNWVR
ncbi:hypothetical protein A2U01_0077098, partial [Trifolium medium]|nr:hypothetical protein [Trifolium medium]